MYSQVLSHKSKGSKMKTLESIKKHLAKITDNSNSIVIDILLLYIALIGLGALYSVNIDDLNETSQKPTKKHIVASEITGESFGTVIAIAKEMDGHCEYRACDKTNKICDWYDNNNKECDGMNKGEWIVWGKHGTYKGISLCSETAGKFAEIGTPSYKPGAYCWCKSGKNWVHHLFLNSSSYCLDNGCAGNCAHGVLYSPAFRSKVINRYKQYTK